MERDASLICGGRASEAPRAIGARGLAVLAGGRMQVEMTEMPAAGQPTDPPVISNFTNPQFRNSGADFEPEPEPSPDEGSPRGLAPDAECSETLQVIGVDENSPVAWSAARSWQT